MKHRILGPIAALAFLAACDRAPKPGTGDTQSPAAAETAAEVPAAAPATPVAANDVLLPGGVKPDFPHQLRSKTVDPAVDGIVKTRLNFEFIGVDAAAVSESLKTSFEAAGYKVAGPSEAAGSTKFFAIASNGDRVGYSITPVGPALKVKLAGDDARGLVGVIWQESEAK